MRKTNALQATNGHGTVRYSGKRTESSDVLRVARDKIARVFRYLEALNQHRNPVQRQLSSQQWSLWLHDLPSHSSTQRGASRSSLPARRATDEVVHSIDRADGEKLRPQGKTPETNRAP